MIGFVVKVTTILLVLIIAGSNFDVGAADDAAPPKMQSARDLFKDEPTGLNDHILAWKLIYYRETLGNFSGGLAQGAICEGMAKLGVGVNLERRESSRRRWHAVRGAAPSSVGRRGAKD